MRKKTGLNKLKLIQTGNAVYTTYQRFDKNLKGHGFIEKVKYAREEFQLPKRMN